MAGTRRKSNKKTIKPGKDIVESMVEEFKDKLIKVIDQDIKELAIDMKNVMEVDSTGLGMLISAKNSFDQAGVELSLKNVPENIGDLLNMLGLDRYFNLEAA